MNKIKQNHPFHLVTPSPWPIILSISIMNNLIMIISWLHNLNYNCLLTIPCSLMCIFQWWRDITREATFQGNHTFMVYKSLRIGMILFIISEIMFFFSFFWAYFHSSLAPSIEIGQMWPPKGIKPFDPMDIPLLNTIILVSSGLTISWTHHSLMNNNLNNSTISLSLTIILGLYFSYLQLIEYKEASFSISDSIFGSIFFMSTGFHGIHVLIGTMFLSINLIRLINLHFSSIHHFGLEAAIWYWHFVDVVWLFLYISVYWWSF